MSWELLAILAVITYGSRAVALVLVPSLPPAVTRVLDRMPAPLFAGLAIHALLGPTGELAGPQTLAATAGALIAAPLRSLPVCLLAGLAGYLIAGLVG